MSKHDWEQTHHGIWENNYRCKKCGKGFQVNHDDANSKLPLVGCESSASPAGYVATLTEARMENRTEVRVIKVTLECERCGGDMRPTGTALMSNPPQYPHECQKCGNTRNIRGKQYPYMEYEAI